MSIRGLRALHAVANHASFADAAASLNVTPSAISMQISALEEALGTLLFDRSRRPPRMTRTGELVLRYAQTIVKDYDAMLAEVATTDAQRAYFRLGVIPTALMTLMPEALMELRRTYPELVVSVTSNLSGDLLRMVDSGEVDGALMHRPHEIDARFEWRDVYRQTVVLLAPPRSAETRPADLFARHPYIRFNRSAWIAPFIEARLQSLGIFPDTTAEVESLEAIHKMVAMGFGVSVVPDTSLRHAPKPPYRVLDFGTPPLQRTIGLLSRRSTFKKRARDTIWQALDRVVAGQIEVTLP